MKLVVTGSIFLLVAFSSVAKCFLKCYQCSGVKKCSKNCCWEEKACHGFQYCATVESNGRVEERDCGDPHSYQPETPDDDDGNTSWDRSGSSDRCIGKNKLRLSPRSWRNSVEGVGRLASRKEENEEDTERVDIRGSSFVRCVHFCDTNLCNGELDLYESSSIKKEALGKVTILSLAALITGVKSFVLFPG